MNFHAVPIAFRNRLKQALTALVIGLTLLGSAPAQSAHPLRLTDYSDRSRIELEIGGGHLKEPLSATQIHYLVSLDAQVYEGLHLMAGIPFSGYEGIDGEDNFIRGNILLGLSYAYRPFEWFTFGTALRFYVPTYEQADPADFGYDTDPRRSILQHWNYRMNYVLEDRFPIQAETAVKFEQWGLFLQGEFGATWAPVVRETHPLHRRTHTELLNWGAGAGYNLLGHVEFGFTLTGVIDPDPNAANFRDLIGIPDRTPRSLHAASMGVRAEYKWAAARFEMEVPIEKDFRARRSPTYLGALQVQFP